MRLARPKPPGRLLDPAGNRGARGMIAARRESRGDRIRLTGPLRERFSEAGDSPPPACVEVGLPGALQLAVAEGDGRRQRLGGGQAVAEGLDQAADPGLAAATSAGSATAERLSA